MTVASAPGRTATPAPLPPGTAVRVRVPASTANLGPGFDSIGLALGVWDEFELTVTDHGGLLVEVQGEGALEVPRDASHLVHRSLVTGFTQLGWPVPEHLRLVARGVIPHSRGLGSSASAIVAGVAAAHGLVAVAASDRASRAADGEVLLDLGAVADLASELEGHPDNATASVYGGLTISWTVDAGDVRAGRTGTSRVPVDPGLRAVVFVPATRLATHTARAVLPAVVPHHEAAQGAGRAALLALAVTGRPELLLPATRDWLHQEPRRSSFPATMQLVDALRAAGHAAVVSGAGPSVLVLTTADREAEVVVPEVGPETEAAAGADAVRPSWLRLTPAIPTTGVSVNSGC